MKQILTAALIATTIISASLEHWRIAGLAFFATVCSLIWHLKDDHNAEE